MQRCVNSRTGVGRVGRRRLDRVLVDETVAAAGQRQREHRNHRRARAQRQRRQRRRRRRGTPEEVHVDRVGRVQVLIDQDAPRRGWRPARAARLRIAPCR